MTDPRLAELIRSLIEQERKGHFFASIEKQAARVLR